jgi:hypothetical protein
MFIEWVQQNAEGVMEERDVATKEKGVEQKNWLHASIFLRNSSDLSKNSSIVIFLRKQRPRQALNRGCWFS